jgi:cation transporter-like permease
MVFIMTNQMLIVFVIFADYAKYNTDGPTVQAAERAMAAFSFFLFVMYAFVGSLLATFRNDIVPPEGSLLTYTYSLTNTYSLTC